MERTVDDSGLFLGDGFLKFFFFPSFQSGKPLTKNDSQEKQVALGVI